MEPEYTEEQLKLAHDTGVSKTIRRVLDLLADDEWHELSKSYTSMGEDLYHAPDYCWACQLIEQVKEIPNG